VIIKFRQQAGVRTISPQLATALTSVSAVSISSAQSVFPNRTSKISVLSVAIDTFGFDRIVLVPLKPGISAEAATSTLQGYPEIEYVEPNYIYHIDALPILPSNKDSITNPNDSLFYRQWYLQDINVPEAWQVSEGDSTIHIGFVDTGVDWRHPDLVNQFAINPKEDINHNGLFDPWPSTVKGKDAHGDSVYGDLDGIDEDGNGFADDVIGYNFVDQTTINYGKSQGRDAIPVDENGHGTLVAGVMGAQKNNHIGIAGIAPKCKLVALRAFDFSGNAEDDDIAAAIVYAADNHVNILNLSFGDVIPSMLQRDAIRYATSKGVLVFASAGNNGGDGRHYPSDFDECVSVGAVTGNDNIWIQSEYGEQMALVAPGDTIMSLSVGDSGYTSQFSGTSFSSPITAATAALLWSVRPQLTPIELRSILESTTKDITIYPGYDHLSANGRLDAEAAITYRGSSAIKITSPHTDAAYFVADSISILGYAVSTLFQSYSLTYALGINPDNKGNGNFSDQSVWIPIAASTHQVENGVLGTWLTSGLTPGNYTIRLAVQSSDLRSTEERMIVSLSTKNPQLVQFFVDSIYANEKRALLIAGTTDQVTTCALYSRPQGSSTWSIKQDDRFTHHHSILLTKDDAIAGVPLELLCILKNQAGDSVSIRSVATILTDDVSERGFSQKSYTLPPGFVMDSVIPTTNGEQVALSYYTDGVDFGPLETFRFDLARQRFSRVDSTIDGAPIAMGNTRADTKPELLIQQGTSGLLLGGNTSHALLGDTLFNSNKAFETFFTAGLADIDGDGKESIIGVKEGATQGTLVDTIVALKWDGSVYQTIGRTVDTTWPGPPPYYAVANFNGPQIATADFLATGKKDIVIVDALANVIGYHRDETSPSGFAQFFLDENEQFAEGSTLTTGDFNGDGMPDIAFAYHRLFTDLDQYQEYATNFWTLKVFLNQGNGKFALNTVENFYYARDPTSPLYPAGLQAIQSVTGRGRDCLAFSAYPNFYLMEYDATSSKVKPIWHYPLSISRFGAIAHDFDHNGRTEFGFLAGDSIRFFESDSAYATRTATPGGLTVIPRDTNRVDLTWGAVEGADWYTVLRADTGTSQYDSVWQTTSTKFSDTSVVNNAIYLYSVNAVDTTKSTPGSENAFSVEAYVHSTPRVDSILATGNHLMVRTTQPLLTKALSGGGAVVDDSINATSIADANDSAFLMTMSSPLSVGQHSLRLDSWEIRDFWNSPFDTSLRIEFSVQPLIELRRFYIVSWTFESSSRIHLIFNAVPDTDGLDVSHYGLTPFGIITGVERDPSDSLALYLDLNPSKQIAPIGTAFVLCVSGIHDDGGDQIEPTEGNCAGETLTSPDLTHTFVFPNPAKQSIGTLTFAGLTATAEISIFTQDMRFLGRIETSAKDGGLQWDMKDENGRMLPSGVYIYHVTGSDNQGNAVTPHEGKFVIIGDQ
jgi:subtilisin family serine protease